MELTRLISYPTSKILLLLLFLASWNISTIFADDEVVEATTLRPARLSAILRNIGLLHITTEKPLTIEPTPEELTITPTPATRLPFRRRVSVRVRRLKDLNRVGTNSSFSPEILNPEESKPVHNFVPTLPRKRVRSRETKPAHLPLSKISGIDQGTRHPGDIIRNALINHTLEHGGEQDLDKLVFSNLPNGSKLVLRTVKIVRTDGDGNPMDDEEGKQPTYWDVTLANATDSSGGDGEGEEEDDEEDSDEDENEEGSGKEASENIDEKASTREITTPEALTSVDDSAAVSGNDTFGLKGGRRRGRKKADLESSGSHSAVNYHHLNGYGSTGRDKERGTTHFHGNDHGNTHKQTYTKTDGKDVKPYHGTEKGLTDYSNDHGHIKKDEGERFKTSKKKNKGRKVTGFKRVYHKEEYQRTEHFYDDEEAKKIAESFGLSDAKDADNHGTKGDKRKYQGVHTEYLDGKKHENEHGTHDGYNKGKQTTYKETEKHGHHSNYGKSQSHGSPPHHNSYDAAHNDHQNLHSHNDHQQQNNQYNHNTHQADYHPNHNYHAASYSSPKQSTIHQVPKSVVDQLRKTHDIAAIVSAPMATSFTVTEFSPLLSSSHSDTSVSTPNPALLTAIRAFPQDYYNRTTFTLQSQPDNQTDFSNDGINFSRRRRPFRKRQREKKMFFSPKHRFVKEDDAPTQTNTEHQQQQQIAPYNPTVPVSYQVSSVSDILQNVDNENNGQVAGENDTKYTPYAPNFGPATDSPIFIAASPGGGGGERYNSNEREVVGTGHEGGAGRHQHRPIKTWLWPPRHRHPKRPRPTQQVAYSPRQIQELLQAQGHRSPHHHNHPQASRYPVLHQNQMHLASIPFRHASAIHKLGNRHHRYSTLKHKHPHNPHPSYLHPYEISTRKSDTDVDDDENANRTSSLYPPPTDNDSAQYYFNHNHRYAKHHLTSTINPVPSESSIKNNDEGNRVRNTLLDPVPGTYSTVIKVLPATMLNVNSSSSHDLPYHDSKIPAVTQRPLTAADSISITTAYPHLLPQHAMSQHHHMRHPQESRPFLPKPRWLTFTMNLRNPMDFKVGTEYANHGGGPQHQQMGQSVSHQIMRGLKNGILKPFTRGSHNNMLAASPSVTPQHGFQRGPYGRAPMMQRHPHPVFAHNMVSYNNFGGMLPLMSKQQVQSVAPPSKPETSPATLLVIKSDRPKFYYNYKPTNETGNQTKVELEPEPGPDQQKEQSAESRGDSKEKIVHKPTLKVSKTLAIATSSGPPTITLPPTNQPELQKRHSTQSPPFVNGIMDSVANFFGRMG